MDHDSLSLEGNIYKSTHKIVIEDNFYNTYLTNKNTEVVIAANI